MTQRLETLRPIDQILDRYHRRQNRLSEFPPDFVHGDATLDELYEVFGEDWVENVAFVQHHQDQAGRMVAVSIAYFTDWFLTIEHASLDDGVDLEPRSLQRWLQNRIGGRHTIIELRPEPSETPSFDGSRWIDLCCPFPRLLELERTSLFLSREDDGDWMTTAQTNLLSTIVLCARLGMERVN